MEDLHLVSLQVAHDAAFAPQRLVERQEGGLLGIAETDSGQSLDLGPQVVATLIGGVESQFQAGWQIGQVAHQRAAVTA